MTKQRREASKVNINSLAKVMITNSTNVFMFVQLVICR